MDLVDRQVSFFYIYVISRNKMARLGKGYSTQIVNELNGRKASYTVQCHCFLFRTKIAAIDHNDWEDNFTNDFLENCRSLNKKDVIFYFTSLLCYVPTFNHIAQFYSTFYAVCDSKAGILQIFFEH